MSHSLIVIPEKVYYDVLISNLNSQDVVAPVAYYNETRNTPFLQQPELYYMSIIRFSLDSTTLPVFRPVIQANSTNVNKTIYSITLQYSPNNVRYFESQQFIIYAPQNVVATVPSAPAFNPKKVQNNNTAYYDIYSYQYFIFLINNTFTTAYADLNAKVIAGGFPAIGAHAPIMTFDTSSSIAILNSQYPYYSQATAHPVNIFFNPSLIQLFSSFPATLQSYTDDTGKNYQIETDTFGGSSILQAFPTSAAPWAGGAIQTIQEYSTVANWTPISAIVFTSNTLPIVPNQVGEPEIIVDGISFNTGGNNANIAQIITDFISDSGIYKPNIVYQPSAQYRYIEMLGNRPVYNLDVGVFYRDRMGEMFPVRLAAGSTITIKFLFTLKSSLGNYKN